MLPAIEKALNAVLRQDPESLHRAHAMAGRVIVVEVPDLPAALEVAFHEDGVRLGRHRPGDPRDARVRAGLLDLVRAVGGSGRGELPANIAIEGDAELARDVARLAVDLDFDWEGRLQRIAGAGIAHQFGRLAGEARAAVRAGGRTLQSGIGEYLTEERALLAPRPLVELFLDQIDELAADVDRLEQRLLRLERRS